jgi:hypothetical protein
MPEVKPCPLISQAHIKNCDCSSCCEARELAKSCPLRLPCPGCASKDAELARLTVLRPMDEAPEFEDVLVYFKLGDHVYARVCALCRGEWCQLPSLSRVETATMIGWRPIPKIEGLGLQEGKK